MAQLFTNAARAELASTVGNLDTTITLAAGGALFPVANTGAATIGPSANWFKAVLQDGTGIEIVYVRTHTSASLTFSNVLRGQEGTSAREFLAASVVGLRPTAADAASNVAHQAATNNPHNVTKAHVGLGSVDNTADSDKPVSDAQQLALDAKVSKVGDDSTVTRMMVKDSGFVYYNATTAATLNYTNGSHQRWAPTGTVTLALTNWPPSGNLGEMLIEGVNLGAATITWPGINWILFDGTTSTTFADTEVALQASGTDWVFLWTRDAGTTIYGKVVR